ncbi:MAG: phosphodiester glycosidase family protein [Chloroflexota bacterium]|nr:MAG: hypothetical protein DIU80_11240 [Chloroflexota bacterium]
MTQRRAIRYCHILLLIAAALVVSCASEASTPRETRTVPTLLPTAALVSPAPADDPTQDTTPDQEHSPPDTGWMPGDSGIELRRLQVDPGDGRLPFPVVIVRLDPSQVRLRVAYSPQEPRSIASWFELRRPLLAINGAFFTPEYAATALVISDGVVSGSSYEGFGGMLAVSPGDEVTLWPLRDVPYDPSVPLAQAVQSFPMLVFPGGSAAQVEDNGQRARRTAVAIDRSGRVLFIVSPTSGFSLRELAEWLAGADLEIDRALNLDGGSSTGLYLSAGPLQEQIESFGPLPIVILAEPR